MASILVIQSIRGNCYFKLRKNVNIMFSWVKLMFSWAHDFLNRTLFQTNEKFEISITPPFKIIVGNAGGIVGFYNQSEINFTQVANELNVSLIEVKDE